MYDRQDLIWDGRQLRLFSSRGVCSRAIEPDRNLAWHVACPSAGWTPHRHGEPVAGYGRSGFARAWRSEPAPGGRMSGRRSRARALAPSAALSMR